MDSLQKTANAVRCASELVHEGSFLLLPTSRDFQPQRKIAAVSGTLEGRRGDAWTGSP